MYYQEKPSLKDCVDAVCENILIHDGVGHLDGGNSGRFPWGSGDNPYQHQPHALITFDEKMRKAGLSEREIIDAWNGEHVDEKNLQFTTTQYRTALSVYKSRYKQSLQKSAQYLHDVEHRGPTEIARMLGLPNESSARSLLDEQHQANINKAEETANVLKKRLEELDGGYLVIGKGTEHELGVTKNKLDNALFILDQDGYPHYDRRVDQVTNKNNKTTIRVLCPPGTEYKDVYAKDALSKMHSYVGYESEDKGKTFQKTKAFQYPESLDSSRLYIKYGDDEDSGKPRDGLIEIRPGVADLSLGGSRYAQVRIMVDGTHYLKGMAVYSDNVPEGYDIMFNSNKLRSKGIYGSLKPLQTIKDENGKEVIDKENPFGALLKLGDDKTTIGENGGQSYYTDPKTGEQKLSLINKTRLEGDWEDWKDTLPSQFLAKQSKKLINTQLSATIKDKEMQYKDILSVNNPTVKKKMLWDFADECDTEAVDLKAMALPGQKWNVIIPISSMPDNEVYAPGYKDGETVALVRYPHEGTFQIPILTVNNKRREGQKIIGKDTIDAIGINASVAQKLSGADFDGDTAMLIPCNSSTSNIKIVSTTIKELEDFEPSDYYSADDDSPKIDKDGKEHYYQNGKEYPILSKENTQREMGVISNLIMDMTLQGADEKEITRATRYSMTVIDAAKHKLNYKQAAKDNDIQSLKHKYQIHIKDDGSIHYGGAATLITKAGSETSRAKTQGSPHIDEVWDPAQNKWIPTGKNEGKLYWKPAENLYYPEGSYDKETHIKTLKTVDGQKIQYDVTDTTAYNKYTPVLSVDKDTGEAIFISKDGKLNYSTKMSTTKSTKMKETDDASTLISLTHTAQEEAYAKYANTLKSMANEARKEYMQTPEISYNPEAKAKYRTEYESLMSQLKLSEKNAPREAQAQIIANMVVQAKKEQAETEGIKLSSKELGKIQQKAITQARLDTGASRHEISITEKEWEAIQAGAIGSSNLSKILLKADPAQIREYALPQNSKGLTPGQINRIKTLNSSNYTTAQIASIVGVSPTTVYSYLNQ